MWGRASVESSGDGRRSAEKVEPFPETWEDSPVAEGEPSSMTFRGDLALSVPLRLLSPMHMIM